MGLADKSGLGNRVMKNLGFQARQNNVNKTWKWVTLKHVCGNSVLGSLNCPWEVVRSKGQEFLGNLDY